MITFLFWNLQRQDRLDALDRLAREHAVDVFLLAESLPDEDGRGGMRPADVLLGLNASGRPAFHYNVGQCPRIAIYSRFSKESLVPTYEEEHLTIRHFQPPARTDVLLVVAHLQSKLHQSRESQGFAATEVARVIAHAEKRIGHQRTILVGDLNMHPFEEGMVAAAGLHATMDRRIAGRRTRTVGGKSYPFFYNPMWGLLGDASRGPPGTYYRSQSEHVSYFWHMFDQVLLRPDVLPMFGNGELSIVESDGARSFLTKRGLPDEKIASDHLPILFRIRL
jgi:endonuclease/exonuclease/phosphatase family metal-dependent hydrolase